MSLAGLNPLDREFVAALAHVQEYSAGFTKKDALAFYGMEKQALYGDCTEDRSRLKLITHAQKRRELEAWIEFRGIPSDHCKELFISKLRSISPSFDPEITLVTNPAASAIFRNKLLKPRLNTRDTQSDANDEELFVDDFSSDSDDNYIVSMASSRVDRMRKMTAKSFKVSQMEFNDLEQTLDRQEFKKKTKRNRNKDYNENSYWNPPPAPPVTVIKRDTGSARKSKKKGSQVRNSQRRYKTRRELSGKPQKKRDLSFDNGELHMIGKEEDPTGTGTSFTTDEYKTVYDQVYRFYSKVNPEMLHKGIEHHVLWALAKGIKKLDSKLKRKYMIGLPIARDPQDIHDVPFPQKSLAQINAEKKEERKQKKSNAKDDTNDLKNQLNGKSDFSIRDAFMSDTYLINEMMQEGNETQKRQDLREFKKRLTLFLLEHEPDRIDQCLVIMTKFMQKKGTKELNIKLKKNYGKMIKVDDLFQKKPTRLSSRKKGSKRDKQRVEMNKSVFRVSRRDFPVKMNSEDEMMLALFFTKNDPDLLRGDQVNQVQHWANSHGMASLNRQLKKRYKQDLDEFMFYYRKLRQEVVEFYTIIDSKKLSGIDKIMEWAVVNGREELNRQLRKRYSTDLDASTRDMREASTNMVDF